MPDTPEELQRRIDAIEAQRSVIGDAAADAALAVLRAQLTASVYGNANAGINSGQNTGANYGVIQQFLYAQPTPTQPAPPPPPAPPPTLAEQLETLAEQVRQQQEQRKQQQRDVLAAAVRYQQLGGRAGLARGIQIEQIEQIEDELRKGLADLLTYPALAFPFDQRMQAGRLLGMLGDPRFPTSPAQWQAELAQRSTTFGQPNGYFCYVPAGTYAVGGWGKDVRGQPDHPAVQHALPQYWIARYPISNQQWQAWVDAGGTPSYATDESRYNAANQPVVGVTWYEAMAYAAWLMQQIADALPAGYEIRLPTEAEWETAAAYDEQGTRRMYPWGDAPEPDADYAIFEDAQGNNLGVAAPVGLCVAGVAACGAADMAGNVFEWCASSYKGYPQTAATFKKHFTGGEFDVPLRGGSWWNNSTYTFCGARIRIPLGGGDDNHGVRMVCAPRLR